MRELAIVDFETEGIDPNGPYPPKPVGFALDRPGHKPEYFAWGHTVGNSCDETFAKAKLRDIYEEYDVCFHNAQFDLDVGETYLGLKPKLAIHDTLILAFLFNPHAPTLELKKLAENLLGVAPREQDKLREWICANIPAAKRKKTEWAAHISEAPGELVARYACGDVTRTRKLFKYLSKRVLNDRVSDDSGALYSMANAYDRELRMIDISLKMQRRGICIDRKRLQRDVGRWAAECHELQIAARSILNRPNLELGKAAQLTEALEASGKMSHWLKTLPSARFPDGQKSVSWKSLNETLTDRKLYGIIRRWSQITHYITTFALPWLTLSERDGRVHPLWSCTRKDGKGGARSGRLVSNPNWQNIPDPRSREGDDTTLPILRNYVVPSPDHTFISRDYIQQEFRILAHFEDGPLLAMYQKDPLMDIHSSARAFVSDILHRPAEAITRKMVKGLGFGILYGQGLQRTADEMGTDLAAARQIRTAYGQFINIKDLQDCLKDLARNKQPMRTWGGRLYYCEEPKFIDGRLVDFAYKMVNYLIQPSAADCTKEAMIAADDAGIELVLSVHDDLIADVPSSKVGKRMRQLQRAMEGVRFNLPMLTTSKTSARSWGGLENYREPQPGQGNYGGGVGSGPHRQLRKVPA